MRFRLLLCLVLDVYLVVCAHAELPLARSEQLAAGSLDQDGAVALALAAQPLLAARSDAVHALREDAAAAGQLPDPKLSFGVQALSVDSFNFNSMDMTQAMIGISQMVPGGAKRGLNRARGESQALLAESDLASTRRDIEREVRLAWIDLWQPTQALGWLHRLGDAYELQLEWGEVSYKAGKLTRDEILQWQAMREGIRDRESEQRMLRARARAQLRRWLGTAGDAEPVPDLPPALSLGAEAEARLERHPELLRTQRQLDLAHADVGLAREAVKPDWNLGLAYGARSGARADVVSFQVEVDLPVFHAQRQDRRLGARLAEANQAGEQLEDKRRTLLADLRGTRAEQETAQERMRRFEQVILPLNLAREAAAMTEYRSGKGAWGRVLDARRDILETRLLWLAQKAAGARADVQLRYLIGGEQP